MKKNNTKQRKENRNWKADLAETISKDFVCCFRTAQRFVRKYF